MAKNGSITIYQRKQDPDLKRMIRELKELVSENNRYADRSESDIAKMILREGLEKEHRKVCGEK